ncbi:MAG: DNA gyrase inhibitor, partial [Lawsonibacter sp.]|nr:DNA gyrase inhibitor [Lawsonibacter sp.]
IGQLTLSIDNTKPIIERYSSPKIAEHLCEFCIPIIH